LSAKTIVLALIIFIGGFLLNTALSEGYVRYPFSDSTAVDSPSDRITSSELQVFSDRAVIQKQGLMWAKIKNTHSMEPVLNSNSISLELPPVVPTDVKVGDIISFKQGSIVLIHRVIEINQDSEGWYAITKGDNNNEPDSEKVRFEQIQGVVVGILY